MTALSPRSPLLCFITPGHIATNPRLVKEAAAAEAAGYRVRVIFSQYMDEYVAADRSLLEQHPAWDPGCVIWRSVEGPFGLRWRSGLRQRCAGLAFGMFPFATPGVRALGRVYDELLAAACRAPADLYIAHNLAALPVACAAARRLGARVAFDAEDFHRGELPAESGGRRRRLVEWAEQRYIPLCDYVSAASDGIARAYAATLGIQQPTTILNVFPIADMRADITAGLAERERAPNIRSLYWFSQTIGPGRGLEDAVDALAHLGAGFHLYLRGRWTDGYERALFARARMRGVADRVHSLPPVLPRDLLPLTALHDIGLALEQPLTVNRSLCVTNKLFAYLLGGIPMVASATAGQQHIAGELGAAVRLYAPGDGAALAAAVRNIIADPSARADARRLATERFNWEVERERFLLLVRQQVGPARKLADAVA